MKARSFILCFAMVTGGHLWGRQSRLTQHDPYPLYTTMYPYDFLTTNERREAKDMPKIYGNEVFRFNLSAIRSTADSSTDEFKQHKQPLLNLPGPWNITGLFYNQTPVTTPMGSDRLQLTPFQAYLAQSLNINTNTNTAEGAAFQKVIDPAFQDSQEQFGFMDMSGEYRKHGLRFELEGLIGCGFGFRISSGVSDINLVPCIARSCANDASTTSSDRPCDLRDSVKCDPLERTCNAEGRECVVFEEPSDPTTQCGDLNRNCRFEAFTKAEKDLVLNKIIDRFDVLARELGYDPTNYNETDIEDIDFQLYWRCPIHINEDRAQWPYFIWTPFLVGQATAPVADRVSPQELFALAHGNNGFASYGISGGFSLDFIDMVQIAFDAGMTRFNEEQRTCIPVPTQNLQQGILPRFADARIKPGTNWSFGAALYGYYILDRLSFYIEYRIVSHTEDEVTFTNARKLSQEQLQKATQFGGTLVDGNNEPLPNQSSPSDPFSINDINKQKFIEHRKWESHVVNSGLNYDISPNITLGFLWQAPATRRNAFKETSLLWTIAATF